MDIPTKNFWIAVVIGVIVMLGFALVFVNMFQFVPFVGPFIGGLAAGLIGRKSLLDGGRAGLVSGIAGGLIVSLDYLLDTGLLRGATLPVATAAGSIFVITSILYFAILAFIGGAIGGLARH